jgi:hypothetical protein
MNSARLDLVGDDDFVRRDADLAFSILWSYLGQGIDLTGHVLELKIRQRKAGAVDGIGSPLIILDNATNGGITLADQSLTPGKAFYLLTQAQIIAATYPGIYFYTARDLTGGGITPMWYGLIEFRGPNT